MVVMFGSFQKIKCCFEVFKGKEYYEVRNCERLYVKK